MLPKVRAAISQWIQPVKTTLSQSTSDRHSSAFERFQGQRFQEKRKESSKPESVTPETSTHSADLNKTSVPAIVEPPLEAAHGWTLLLSFIKTLPKQLFQRSKLNDYVAGKKSKTLSIRKKGAIIDRKAS